MVALATSLLLIIMMVKVRYKNCYRDSVESDLTKKLYRFTVENETIEMMVSA